MMTVALLIAALLALVFSPAWVPELRYRVRQARRWRHANRRKGWVTR